MGANQSNNNNNDPGSVPITSSTQGSKTITKVKTHTDSPATLSAMSTEEPQYQKLQDVSQIERARKRARQDSESIIDMCDEVHDGKRSTQPSAGGGGELPFSCEVFVSGASCRLPESDNLEEFWHNLIEGRDMVTEDDRRWPPGLHDLPRRNGKLKNISKFDAEFFRINPTQADAMDPQLRVLFEVAYEAIIDSGYNPTELKGSQTGVFVGNMFMEALEATSRDTKSRHIGYGLTSACDSMLSNYLSFYFDFKGPSLTVNTACSASLTAFDLAVKSLLCGQCEFAITAGTNLLLKPGTALHMLRLGMLSKDGTCKTFDASADGYVRSEGIVAVLLTTKENARRAYTQVLNCMSSCDGHKVEGIAYPSSEAQRELIWGVHYEVGLDPSKMFYVEAHGTGTQAGDFEECKALDEAIARSKCSSEQASSSKSEEGKKSVTIPLLVGSVKSNMGHSEPTAGLAGIVKVILSYQRGLIPPNLHYKSPNPRITSLLESRLSVVTTPTHLPPNAHMGVNSFGFGGAITHVILKGCEKSSEVLRKSDIVSKIHVPEIAMEEDVTMVLPVTSRTKQGLKELLDFTATYRTDKEVLTLLLHSFGNAPTDTHPHRGYVLWNKKELVTSSTTLPPQTTATKQQVWFIFDGMGSQWSGIGKDLLQYTLFADIIKKCYAALPSNVNNLILDNQSEMAENSNLIIDEIAAVCAVSIGLVELLRAVGIEPDGLIGHSLGELVLCYADGALTLEECMQTAYWRIRCVMEAEIPKGAMATVGLQWDEVKGRCPDNVWPVCSNSPQNVTISGRADAVEKFIAELDQEKIFTKMVKSSGLPYHSPLMKPAVNEKTFEILNGIIKNPKPKSKKWIVTALPSDADPELVTCSAEFHIRSLTTPVYFFEALQKIPPGSIVVEIGAHALLQAILKRSLSSNFTIIPLQDWKEKDQSVVFMRAVGTCHNAGLSIDPLALVKAVNLPVGPHTPSIGHLMSWEHVEEWYVPKPEDFILHSSSSISTSPVSSSGAPSKLHVTKGIKVDPQNSVFFSELSLADYKIDGSIILPPSYLVILIWQLFAEMKGLPLTEVPVHLSEMQFQKYVEISDALVNLTLTLSTISGHFEIFLNSTQLVASGTISTCDLYKKDANVSTNTSSSEEISSPHSNSEKDFVYPKDDIYKELALHGYQLGANYRVLHELFIDYLGIKSGSLSVPILTPLSQEATLLCMIDGLFQVNLLQSYEQFLIGSTCFEMKGFYSLTVDPAVIFANFCPPAHLSVSCGYNDESQKFTCWTEGLSVDDAFYMMKPRRVFTPEPRIEMYNFHPYFLENSNEEWYLLDAQSSISVMLEITCENVSSKEVTILQVFNETRVFDSTLADFVSKIAKSCSTKNIQHDLMIAGASPDSKTPSKSKVSGHTVRVESFSHNLSITLHYDVIITSSVSTAQSLLQHSKLAPGAFVLVVLNPGGGVQELAIPEKQQGSVYPILVAERQFISSKITTDGEVSIADSASSTQHGVLKLYHFVDGTKLSSEEIIQVSVVEGNFLWISKLKKLLASRDGPEQIYLVSELQREYPSGLLGMMNCLRLEGYGNRLRCVQLMDVKWEELLIDHTLLWDHIKRADMLMNVVKDGQVGSYIHTPLVLSHQDRDNCTDLVPRLISNGTGFTCSRSKTYIITGGLGGFGLELAEWLVEKGARYLVLTSRTGKMTAYKKRKLQILETKGIKIHEVSTLDVSNKEQAFQLVKMAADLSPKGVGGVFHLAVVLRDCLFENQTAKRFKTVLSPKSSGALNIDKALRELSTLHPSYDTPLFVIFSSATSGLGNAGQTNYAFANSSMEHLCELRSLDGLPGSVAIQWGAIAEVGILHTIMGGRDIESIAGTKPQPIHSCLSCLDSILGSSECKCPIISCYIPALQPNLATDKTMQNDNSNDVIPRSLIVAKKDVKSRICQVLGIRDPNRVNIDSQLNGLGLDSLMNFEVRGLLEKDFGVTIASVDLPKRTLRDIVELTSQYASKKGEKDADSTLTTGVRSSTVGEIPDTSVSVKDDEEFTSQTSLATQSSAVNVIGQNDE